MERSREHQAGGEQLTDEEWLGVTSADPREWLRDLQRYAYRWVEKNRHVADEVTRSGGLVQRFQVD